MKKIRLLSLLIIISLITGSIITADTKSKKKNRFKNKKEQTSYCLGANMGKRFKMQNADIDFKEFLNGLKDGIKGNVEISEDELVKTLRDYYQSLRSNQDKNAEKSNRQSIQKGKAFPE